MLIVTGTKRSGTSLWMQIFEAGGFQIVGDAFPMKWSDSIGAANPRGFFKSRLRQGIFYATNPDPKPAPLFPDATREHVVKVFVPGLVRTDYTYVGRVLATIRHWRDYGPSLARLYELEDSFLRANPEGRTGDQAVAQAERTPRKAPAGRRVVRRVLRPRPRHRDPALPRPLRRVRVAARGSGKPRPPRVPVDRPGRRGGRGIARVNPSVRTATERAGGDEGLPEGAAAVLDALYDAIATTGRLNRPLLERMNALNRQMEMHGAPSRERAREDA